MFSTLFGRKKDKDKEPTEPGVKPAPRSNPAPAAPVTQAAPQPRAESPAPPRPPTVRPGPQPGMQPGMQPGPPLGQPSIPRPLPPSNARELARATAEKIDKIESEMTSEMTQDQSARANVPQRPAAPAAPSAARAPAPQPPLAPARKRGKRPDGTSTTLPSLGQTTDILLGDSILANAMELTDSVSSPAIEEAAILFANGQPLPAIAVLSDTVRADSGVSPAVATQAWLMLFELYQALGKKAEFENLAIDYAVRFEASAPGWSAEEADKPSVVNVPAPSGPARAVVAFKGVLNAGIVPQLDQLKRLAQKNPILYLDFSGINTAEAGGADLILRVFAAFQKSNHEVVIEGAAHFAEVLLASIEVGRRDTSNAVWMLLLEIYRILGRQAAFEETSIDYCVTYEVSPPSWEPPSPKFRMGDEVAPMADLIRTVVAPVAELPPDTIALSGDFLGKAENDLARLNAFTAEHRRIVVDCRRLKRVDFTAAGVLLNWAVGAQAINKSIEFRDVSNLVAALFVVMGLNEVAQIERRRF